MILGLGLWFCRVWGAGRGLERNPPFVINVVLVGEGLLGAQSVISDIARHASRHGTCSYFFPY